MAHLMLMSPSVNISKSFTVLILNSVQWLDFQ